MADYALLIRPTGYGLHARRRRHAVSAAAFAGGGVGVAGDGSGRRVREARVPIERNGGLRVEINPTKGCDFQHVILGKYLKLIEKMHT